MVVSITVEQQEALARAQRRSFASRVAERLAARARELKYPPPPVAQVEGWLDEGVAVGVRLAKDLDDLCDAFAEMEWGGARPPAVRDRLADPAVDGWLKVFQVRHAWREHLGVA